MYFYHDNLFSLEKEMQEISTTDSFSSLPFYLGCFVVFFLVLWILNIYFVPYYRSHVKDKLREWILLSHLDSSGQQIQNKVIDENSDLDSDSNFSYPFLKHLEVIEEIFGL